MRELQGQSFIALEDVAPAKQEIACTRSFGRPITALPELVEAVSDFAGRAGEKLRKQDGRANQVRAFYRAADGRLQGAALSGVCVREKDLVAKQLPALLAPVPPGLLAPTPD